MPITRTFRNRLSPYDKVQQKMENAQALQPLAENEQESTLAEKKMEAPSSPKMKLWKRWLTGLFN